MAKLFYRLNGYTHGVTIDIPADFSTVDIDDERLKQAISYKVIQSLISENVIDFINYTDEETDTHVSIDKNSI